MDRDHQMQMYMMQQQQQQQQMMQQQQGKLPSQLSYFQS